MNIKILYMSIFLILITTGLHAQLEDNENEYDKRNVGFAFSMAETGTGLGAYIAWPIFHNTHLGMSLGAYFIRDAGEYPYYDYYYGRYITVGKENNVYLFDFMVTMKRRFFESDLDPSLRPFLVGGVGPYYGMNFPEFDLDPQGNKNYDQYSWALGGFFGMGVDIDASDNYFVSIRFQYRVIPFVEKIGERKNHSMFEIRLEIGSMY